MGKLSGNSAAIRRLRDNSVAEAKALFQDIQTLLAQGVTVALNGWDVVTVSYPPRSCVLYVLTNNSEYTILEYVDPEFYELQKQVIVLKRELQ